jgi:phage regulator Rha-like protein
MSQLEVFEFDEELVVDSRLVAESLGIQHESFMATAKKYQSQVEQAFGVFRFEIGKPQPGSKGGRPESFIYLTDDQATILMTFSSNTLEVIQTKIELVRAFAEARRLLKEKSQSSFSAYTLSRIKHHHSGCERPLPSGYFSCFDRVIEILQRLDIRLNYQLAETWYDTRTGEKRFLEPDISVGLLFSKLFSSDYNLALQQYEVEVEKRKEGNYKKFLTKKLIDLRWNLDKLRVERDLRNKYLGNPLPLDDDDIDRISYKFKPAPDSERPSYLNAYGYSESYSPLFAEWLQEVFFKFRWREYIMERDNEGWMSRYNQFLSLPLNEQKSILTTSEGSIIQGFEFYESWRKQLPPSF